MVRRTRTLTILAALFALILALWAPAALAHHKDDHTRGGDQPSESGSGDRDGDADDDPSTSHDEDSDSDGVDNDDDTTESSHPSGNDRYEESGGSGNQGRSESNPDDTNGPRRFEGEEGSPDKPNGAGGEDIYDQDGNNGCGNDQDFDDDNNGHCGKPDKDSNDDVAGNSNMTIEADCFTVTVTSTKDISHVEVTFADGTTVKFEGLKGHSYSNTFSKQVASARAKSGTTVVSDTVSATCVGATPPTTCPDGSLMPPSGSCDEVQGVIIEKPKPCDADATMPGVQKCEKPEDEVEGAVLDKQPSSPEEEAVLGTRISAAPEVAPAAVAPAAVAAAPEAVGAVLPFTGSSDLLPFVMIALMLIGSGALSLRARRNSA